MCIRDRDWQDKIEVGDGWSYGMEVLLQRKKGRTTGWVGYTLSWTNRQFDNLNGGRVFPYKYDRRHDLSVVVSHKINDRVDIGASYVYGSGYAVTLPVARQQGIHPSPLYNFGFFDDIPIIENRNDFRMRDYHRLDFGVNFTKEKKKYTRVWNISVYNVYSRRNAFFLYFDEHPTEDRQVLKQVSLFPIIPSVSYKFSF